MITDYHKNEAFSTDEMYLTMRAEWAVKHFGLVLM